MPAATAETPEDIAYVVTHFVALDPNDPTWCALLRADVEALDGLEKPFAACDRARFGATTRDRLITAARESYPHAFDATIESVIFERSA